jgi:crotonobetainyl-CoA:carnitine CoA-transferase CaiB-like acyl-CoA transferase
MLYPNDRARRVGRRDKVLDVFGGGRHAQRTGPHQPTSWPPGRAVGTLTRSAGTVPILTGVRVLDRSSGIAGPYCTKVLADAGADVVKVEPTPDPLRTWGSGALFDYLNASKRSITDDVGLAAAADILVTDTVVDVAALHAANPALVIVSVTPFGYDGPWVGRPATEFTLQAACGSTGQRGLPDQPPVAAGGRVGEWVAGTYAAATALAAWREAGRSGVGEHIDVAMLDCMAVTMVTFPSLFASFLGWPPVTGTGRVVEVPSIEPTTDGWAVFTTNSAQQFQDFCVMIGRTDWLDDPEMARVASRFTHRDEFLRAVHDYTTKRSTAEILEDAAALRIPSGPVLNGATVPEFDHFIQRGVFQPNASGRFAQPRVPYRITGSQSVPPGPVPAAGQQTGEVDWEPRPATPTKSWQLPLAGLRIVDLTAWWAGPVAPHALACLGADIIKIESVTRPDLMRYSSTQPHTTDRWYEWGPVFHAVNTGKRDLTLDLTRPEGIGVLERLLATADVLIENYTPRVMDQFGLGWERVHAINPSLVMVRMPAFGLDGPWRDRTGFAQTMESVTGMAWLTGFADGPPVLVRGAGDPLAGMHAVIATLLAVVARDGDGEGRLVESVMVEAALNVAAEQVVEHLASGRLLSRDGNRGPVAAPQGVYQGAGVDRWLALGVADDAQWRALGDLLGRPAWSQDPALATAEGRRAAHDRIDEELAAWVATGDVDELAEQLSAAGVPAAAVIVARDQIHNPQIRHRHLFEDEDHPITGTHLVPGLPVRFSRVARWNRRPSPTLGQHNDEILAEIGLAGEAPRLREQGVIGDRVVGG